MGARAILERALAASLAPTRAAPLRIIELGCGDGLLMLDVARARRCRSAGRRADAARPAADRRVGDLAAYAGAGWRVESLTADVLAWATATRRRERWDVVVANLFVHHFEGAALRTLLAGCARRADALAVCEPRRSRFALVAAT